MKDLKINNSSLICSQNKSTQNMNKKNHEIKRMNYTKFDKLKKYIENSQIKNKAQDETNFKNKISEYSKIYLIRYTLF